MPLLNQEFAGADIIRFNKCLEIIVRDGLKIGNHTQAGLNTSSGNVWVWDEDWAGCIYCSIGFDVAWCYSCPECGHEEDFDSYEALKKYADDWNHAACGECPAV